jgi:hypothetical protein
MKAHAIERNRTNLTGLNRFNGEDRAKRSPHQTSHSQKDHWRCSQECRRALAARPHSSHITKRLHDRLNDEFIRRSAATPSDRLTLGGALVACICTRSGEARVSTCKKDRLQNEMDDYSSADDGDGSRDAHDAGVG